MSERVVKPVGRGFLFLDSHPAGCAQIVRDLAASVVPPIVEPRVPEDAPVALVIGSSSGYGLATTIAGLTAFDITGVGVSFEKPANARRTASAGWYRTAETAKLARERRSRFSFVNADAFADTTKAEVLDLIAEKFGKIDHLIYSVAAPRRTDPRTGETYQSALKTIGEPYTTKSLAYDGAEPQLTEVTVDPATDDDLAQTVKVMGGEDWARWVTALQERDLVSEYFNTVALTYIGSDITGPIYRQGSIGAAKADLEQTALTLAKNGIRAYTSVNGAAVTQASSAIPGIGLYTSLLHKTLGADMQTPIQQSVNLWSQLTGKPKDLDDDGRIRLDRWELTPETQATVHQAWQSATQDNLADVADTDWFYTEVRRLYGFDVPGVDYEAEVEVDVAWPAN
ncbi:enoyl-[acyl-carrier-protein] reductase FabV [Kribbella sandramycini]|uniref:trans-2-enoyl-CoA reductase (NAD(+)) n=1 Tax=Kribbella sandramycini TaxID=60450 RepID=A0A7Y4L448_9ACTN|nr:enoyl-[acyl-carrier-protein] reductase FabV [Kribbella sandramycini]MBB6570848.1 enoyl-[acyl-carrier protein] reductase/trans-2-enoyl-CoA reductase (NAD+) [Kribbella sandramycini]NOL43979.1 enoyl-[acyl-carrier-protein] reductase FabV [Kribbella sandramycini]